MKANVRRLIPTVVLSILLASLLSFVPMLAVKMKLDDQDMAVFQPDKIKIFSRDRLVDFVLSQSIQMDVKRADWNQSTFFLEMNQTADVSDDEMYKQLFHIIKSCLVERNNIHLVRLFVHGTHASSLLVEAKPEQLYHDPKMSNKTKQSYQAYLREKFDLTILPSP